MKQAKQLCDTGDSNVAFVLSKHPVLAVFLRILLLKSTRLHDLQPQERYYLANGSYSDRLDVLDITFPASCVEVKGSGMHNEFVCDTDYFFNNASGSYAANGVLYVYYCPGKTNSWNTCIKGNTEGWGLKMYYDHADETANAGKIICHSGGGKRGNRVCNSWGS